MRRTRLKYLSHQLLAVLFIFLGSLGHKAYAQSQPNQAQPNQSDAQTLATWDKIEAAIARGSQVLDKETNRPPASTSSANMGALQLAQLRQAYVSQARYQQLAQRFHRSADSEALYQLARHAFVHGAYGESIKFLDRMRFSPVYKRFHNAANYLRGAIALKRGKTDQAQAYFATLTSAQTPVTLRDLSTMALARIAFDNRDYKRAVKLYGQLEERRFNWPRALIEYAAAQNLSNASRGTEEIGLFLMLFPDLGLFTSLPLYFELEASEASATVKSDRDALLEHFEHQASSLDIELKLLDELLQAPMNQLPALVDLSNPGLMPEATAHLFSSRLHAQIHRSVHWQYLTGLFEDLRQEQDHIATLAHQQELLRTYGVAAAIDPDRLIVLRELHRLLSAQQSSAGPKHREASASTKIESELEALRAEKQTVSRHLQAAFRYMLTNWPLIHKQRRETAQQLYRKIAELKRSLHALGRDIENAEATQRVLAQKSILEETLVLRQQILGDENVPQQNPEVFERMERNLDALLAQINEQHAQKKLQYDALLPKVHEAWREAEAALQKHAASWIQKFLKQQRQSLRAHQQHIHHYAAHVYYEKLRAFSAQLQERPQDTVKAHGSEPLDQALAALAQEGKAVENIITGAEDPELAYYLKASKAYLDTLQGYGEHLYVQSEQDQSARENAQARESDTRLAYLRWQAIAHYATYLHYRKQTPKRVAPLSAPSSDGDPKAQYRLAQLYIEASAHLGINDENEALQAHLKERGLAYLRTLEVAHPYFAHRDQVLFLRAYLYLEQNDRENALRYFLTLADTYPGSTLIDETYLRIGELYFEQRQFALANTYYLKVLQKGVNPLYDKALYKVAWSKYLLGDYQAAMSYFFILLDYANDQNTDQSGQQFEREAQDYIAFSLFQSGGASSAERVFNDLGWKTYAKDILLATARIFLDRGNQEEAYRTLSLLEAKFPVAAELPEIYRMRLAAIEKYVPSVKIEKERQYVLRQLDTQGAWFEKHVANFDKKAQANALRYDIQFSLASVYELAEKEQGDQLYTNSLRYYSELINGAGSEEELAYRARYRRAQIWYLQGKYKRAAHAFELLSRNVYFNQHFDDSLYFAAVCREKDLMESLAKESDQYLYAGKLALFTQAALDLSEKSNDTPKIYQTLYRVAELHEDQEQWERALAFYRKISQEAPDQEMKRRATLSVMEIHLKTAQYAEAAAFYSTVPKALRENTAIANVAERAQFHLAENDVARIDTFIDTYPKSSLAPKALYKAYLLSSQANDLTAASSYLKRIGLEYPESQEASSLFLDQAIIAEKKLDFAQAKKMFAHALKTDRLENEVRGNVLFYYGQMLILEKTTPSEWSGFTEALKDVDAPTSLEVLNAMYHLAEGTRREDQVNQIIFKLIPQTLLGKQVALKQAAVACTTPTTCLRDLQDQVGNGAAPNSQLDRGQAAVRLRIAQLLRAQSERIVIDVSKASRLKASLQKKGDVLAQAEKNLVESLQLNAPYDLMLILCEGALTYGTFAETLSQKKLPAGLSESERSQLQDFFAKTAQTQMSKGRSAFDKAMLIASEKRYQADLIFEAQKMFRSDQMQTPPQPAPNLSFQWQAIPDLPLLGVSEDVSSKNRNERRAFEYTRIAAEGLTNPWSEAQRLKSREALSKALFINPNNIWAIYNTAKLDMYVGDDHLFAQKMNLVADHAFADRTLLHALQLFFVGQWGKVIEVLASPSTEQGRYLRVLSWLKLGKSDRAEAETRDWLNLNPEGRLPHLAQAWIYFTRGDKAPVRYILRAIVKKDAYDMHAAYLMAWAHDQPEIKRSWLLKAAEQNHPFARFNWAVSAWQAGNVWAAHEEMKKLVKEGGGRFQEITQVWDQFKHFNQP